MFKIKSPLLALSIDE